MHPGMMYWWKSGRRHADRHAWAGCGPQAHGHERHWNHHEASGDRHGDSGAAFGVRRPLRFLAYKLDLDEAQVTEMARILDELKTERAQADVDGRRTIAAFADTIDAASFDATKAAETAAQRTRSAERLAGAVSTALARIHALLEPEQRTKLAYLVRTGVLTL